MLLLQLTLVLQSRAQWAARQQMAVAIGHDAKALPRSPWLVPYIAAVLSKSSAAQTGGKCLVSSVRHAVTKAHSLAGNSSQRRLPRIRQQTGCSGKWLTCITRQPTQCWRRDRRGRVWLRLGQA